MVTDVLMAIRFAILKARLFHAARPALRDNNGRSDGNSGPNTPSSIWFWMTAPSFIPSDDEGNDAGTLAGITANGINLDFPVLQ